MTPFNISFPTFFQWWKIHVFPCNFLINKDRSLGNVASERRFQELSKPLIFFENQLNLGWDMSKDSYASENWWHFFIIFKKWIIHVFPCNFLMNKDRCLGNVASESRFQELSKPLIFFENRFNFGWDISLGRWFYTYGQGRTNNWNQRDATIANSLSTAWQKKIGWNDVLSSYFSERLSWWDREIHSFIALSLSLYLSTRAWWIAW